MHIFLLVLLTGLVLIWLIELEFGFDTLSFWMDHLRIVDLLCCVPELYMLKMYLFAQYSIFLKVHYLTGVCSLVISCII
jgi:hypothetical protein